MRRILFSSVLLGFILFSRAQKDTRKSEESNLKRLKILTLLGQTLSYSNLPKQDDDFTDFSILTWNILAPIFVNETSLRGRNVDLNLLDSELRLRAIVRHILEIDADVVNLQEIQKDTYEFILESVDHVYDALPLAAHGDLHWLEYMSEYKENGFATFYKKDKFVVVRDDIAHNDDFGNVVDGNVLRMTKGSSSLPEPLLFVLNCHLQNGVSLRDVERRVMQGNATLFFVKRVKEELRYEFPSEEPLVFIAGDINSITGAPGLENLKKGGFIDARDVTNNRELSIIHPEPSLIAGLSVDTVLVAERDVEYGRVRFHSTTTANLQSREYDEGAYVRRMMNIFLDELKEDKISKEEAVRVLRLLHSSLTDGKDYNNPYNRALRIGSDHLSVLVRMKIKNKHTNLRVER